MATPAPENDQIAQFWEQNVAAWAAAVQAGGREAIAGLTRFVCHRVVKLAELTDRTVGADKRMLAELTASTPLPPSLRSTDNQTTVDSIGNLDTTIEAALFHDKPPIANVRAFYTRSAAVMRQWFLLQLPKFAARCSNEETKRRLAAWCEFHQEAGKLSEDLRIVHDLMFYANVSTEASVTILGQEAQEFEADKNVVIRLLKPIFDKARGKKTS